LLIQFQFGSKVRGHSNTPLDLNVRSRFRPEMVFLAHLGINPPPCLWAIYTSTPHKRFVFLILAKPGPAAKRWDEGPEGRVNESSFPDWKLSPTGKSFPDGDDLNDGFGSDRRLGRPPAFL